MESADDIEEETGDRESRREKSERTTEQKIEHERA